MTSIACRVTDSLFPLTVLSGRRGVTQERHLDPWVISSVPLSGMRRSSIPLSARGYAAIGRPWGSQMCWSSGGV